jgi:Ca-activated chloride channel family protein
MSMSGASKAIGAVAVMLLAAATLRGQQQGAGEEQEQGDSFRFRSGVELINVTATVTDANGRFVPGLRQEDFTVYEDNRPQTVTHFSSERVPVSLGVVLDTSGSMAGDKIQAARQALDRFLYDLLDRNDEIFLYRFSNDPVLLQSWTSDRSLLSRALGRLVPNGGTAMYDAVAEAIPLAEGGKHVKKAVLVISDGNDTSSRTTVREVQQQIRESEVLVYAIGIDGDGEPTLRRAPLPPPRMPMPMPFPFPGRGRGGWPQPQQPPISSGGRNAPNDDRVNVVALRDMTDDSGGRTEIIRRSSDLEPATAGIADELSRQYYLGYAASGVRDGRYHTIRVEVRKGSYHVRARRGYVAS